MLQKILNKETKTKPIEDTSNNQSRVTITFNDLINERKK